MSVERLEKVLSQITALSNNICNKEKEFNESLEDIVPTRIRFNDEKSGEMRNLLNKIEFTSRELLHNVEYLIRRHTGTVEKEKQDVEHLKEELDKLKATYDVEVQIIEEIKKQTEVFEKEMETLENLKGCVKAYKLLTGAEFVYEHLETNTTGYIKDKLNNFEIFDFNNSEVSEKEVTEKLWSLLQQVSQKDSLNTK